MQDESNKQDKDEQDHGRTADLELGSHWGTGVLLGCSVLPVYQVNYEDQ